MKTCLHCGEQLGILRSLRSSFCSDQHQKADAERMQRLMLERLQQSACRLQSRYRAANAATPTDGDLSEIYQRRYLELMAKLANSPQCIEAKSGPPGPILATQS
jgi:hypothetical protein